MIRFIRELIPAALTIDGVASWDDVRTRFRRYVDEVRLALIALPRFEERSISWDPADGDITVALAMRPRAVWCVYVTEQGSTAAVATSSCTWQPGASGRSLVLSAIGGLSSGIRYDVRLFVAGVD